MKPVSVNIKDEPEICTMVKFDNEDNVLEIPCKTVEIAEITAKHYNEKRAIAWVRVRPFE